MVPVRMAQWFGWLAVMIVATLGTTGCFDAGELEEQAFLVTLGVDQADRTAPLTLIARVAVPSKLSAGAGGSGGGGGDYQSGTPVVTAQGRTIHEALTMMNTGVERSINLSHIAAILFSDRSAKLGLLQYLRTLTRYRQFRRTLYMFVAEGSLGDVFLKDHPVLEMSATRLIEDLHDSSVRTGFAPSVELHQFLGKIESPNCDPVLPILAYNPQVGKEKKKEAGSPEDLRKASISSTSGTINRAGGNPVECVGTALFRGDRMVGELTGEQTRFLQLLNATSNRITLSVPEPRGGPGYLTVSVRYAEPIRVDVNVRAKPPQVHISQSFEAELLGDQNNSSYVSRADKLTLQHVLSTYIKSRELTLLSTLYRHYDIDPVGLFSFARGQFADYNTMIHYDWRAQLPKLQPHIVTEVSLRRMGTQLNPAVDMDTELDKLPSPSEGSASNSGGGKAAGGQRSGLAAENGNAP